MTTPLIEFTCYPEDIYLRLRPPLSKNKMAPTQECGHDGLRWTLAGRGKLIALMATLAPGNIVSSIVQDMYTPHKNSGP